MRTTLSLDPDVAAMLKKAVAKGDATFKEVVNTALRKGLVATEEAATPRKRFVQRVGPPSGFLIDIDNNAAMYEMWDAEDYGDLSRRQSPPVRD